MNKKIEEDISKFVILLKENYILSLLNYYFFQEYSNIYYSKHKKLIKEILTFPMYSINKASELLSKTEDLIYMYKINIPLDSVSNKLINEYFDSICLKESFSVQQIDEFSDLKIKIKKKTITYLKIKNNMIGKMK